MSAALPPAVLPGARVGVAALSSVVDPERLERGLAELARLGFEPVPARNLRSRSALFAGDDGERIAAFHELVDDPSLEAIFFARGGHGLIRLLPRLDWARIAQRPRAFIGYSDLSPLLHRVVTHLGWVAFHGPMVAAELASGLSGEEEESLLGALAGDYPRAFATALGEQPSEVAGTLLGGCLSLFAATCGTPYAATFAGSILFLEDVDEPAFRVDRMLTQLRLSGSLAGVRAMVIGDSMLRSIGEEGVFLLRELTGGLPIALGLAAGHTRPNLTLPLGLPSRLDAALGALVVESPRS